MNIQTITMLTWAYATAAPYNKALFATCCEVVLNDWHSIDLRVRTPTTVLAFLVVVLTWDTYLNKASSLLLIPCQVSMDRGIAVLQLLTAGCAHPGAVQHDMGVCKGGSL